MRIDTNGNVGIGTTSPSTVLHVGGGCITGSLCSDARLKRKAVALPADDSVLERVLRLQGVTFEWKDARDGRRNIGLIAQEVEKVFPEVVTTPEPDNGQKGLSCTGLDAVLVEAIKAQHREVAGLRDEVRSLKSALAEVEELRREMGAVKAKLTSTDRPATPARGLAQR